MVASVASCLQKIGFDRFSVVTELLPAQGHVFRKSMHTDTVFRKLPICLNLFCSQHVSRAELSSLPPPIYRSFYWATWRGGTGQDYNLEATLQKTQCKLLPFIPHPSLWQSLAVRPAAIGPHQENCPSTVHCTTYCPLAVEGWKWGGQPFSCPCSKNVTHCRKRDLFDMFG